MTTIIKCSKTFVQKIKKLKDIKKDPSALFGLFQINHDCIDSAMKFVNICSSPVLIALSATPYVGGPVSFVCSKLDIFALKIEMLRMKVEKAKKEAKELAQKALGDLEKAGKSLVKTTYKLSSNSYSDIYNNKNCLEGSKCGSYSSSMKLTGEIVFQQLQPNLNRESVLPFDWKISDGINSFTKSNSYIDGVTKVTTDASGNVTQLEIILRQWQNPSKTNISDFLNEIWILPNNDYFSIFTAVQCGEVSGSKCFLAFYGDYSSRVFKINGITLKK